MNRQQEQPTAGVLNDLAHALPLIGRHLAAPAAASIVAITGPHTTITVERNPDISHRITIDIYAPRAA